LQRSDVDTSLKDFEGYTAFDLYNSTVNDTKPDANNLRAELFTWGTNRYASQSLKNFFLAELLSEINPNPEMRLLAMAMAMTEHIQTVLSSKSRMTQRRAYKLGSHLSS
jgi:hypothetical protein